MSVADAIRRSTGLEAQIKWPNDVLVRGKKVAGILIEHGAATVVGIGLNVNQTEEDLRLMGLSEASSLSLCCGWPLDVESVARALIESLDARYDGIQNGGLNDLLTSWTGSLGVLGAKSWCIARTGSSAAALAILIGTPFKWMFQRKEPFASAPKTSGRFTSWRRSELKPRFSAEP